MDIRSKYMLWEEQNLSKFAFLSKNSAGRGIPEKECCIRTVFQRDRDKIIHSKAFRRLKHKTQVFILPAGDHYRTRLTHTLEVCQIARTIARALCLNEDLTEAVSLGHDLGHTPFGHAGERALNQISPNGFKHYVQSCLIAKYDLNLSLEVCDGILNHTGVRSASTLEGQIVKYADRIAYVNHDIDDALRAGVLKETYLPTDCIDVIGKTHSQRINNLIMAIVTESYDKNFIKMECGMYDALLSLRKFMFDNVYLCSGSRQQEERVLKLISALYDYYMENLHVIPNYSEEFQPHELVCNYISGMTDNFAIHTYKDIILPSVGIY